ncbi:hypothetical protein AAFF_G00123940 [Aldrovandia affinis]|uniref:Uncharacterized protein n=1 Tax=Aldrovandia affinis TaxID=143900 RepID=A0AAD7R0X0_9TELE|nr:hypothetical protein AAFF_G00123940 [Aldrovandia affinis]
MQAPGQCSTLRRHRGACDWLLPKQTAGDPIPPASGGTGYAGPSRAQQMRVPPIPVWHSTPPFQGCHLENMSVQMDHSPSARSQGVHASTDCCHDNLTPAAGHSRRAVAPPPW